MASISDYLRDFSRGGGAAGLNAMHAAAFERAGREPAPPAAVTMFEDTDGAQELIDEAYRRGRQEQAEESACEHEAALEAERERHAAEIEALKAEHQQEHAATIERLFSQLRRDVSRTVSGEVADALVPFLDQELSERAVARLAAMIAGAIGEREVAPVSVTGPKGMFEALVAAAGETAPEWRFREADVIDLSVEIDGTVFATRLAEWREALKEQVG